MNYIRDFDKIDEDRSIYYYIRQLQIIVERASEEIETTRQYTTATSSLESVNSATALETIHDIETNLPINTTYTETVDYGGDSDSYGDDTDITIDINNEGDDTNVSINTGENTVNVDTQDNTSTVTNTDNTAGTTTNTGTTTTNTDNTTTTTTSGGTTVTESPNDIASGIDKTGGGTGTTIENFEINSVSADGNDGYTVTYSDGSQTQVSYGENANGEQTVTTVYTDENGNPTGGSYTVQGDPYYTSDNGIVTTSTTVNFDGNGNTTGYTQTQTQGDLPSGTGTNTSGTQTSTTTTYDANGNVTGTTTTTTTNTVIPSDPLDPSSTPIVTSDITITTTDSNGNTTESSVYINEDGTVTIGTIDSEGNMTSHTYDADGFDTSDSWTDSEQDAWDSNEDANFWGDE